jgi:hypothetical protein
MWADPAAISTSLEKSFQGLSRRHVLDARPNTVSNFVKEHRLGSDAEARRVLTSSGSVAKAKIAAVLNGWMNSAERLSMCKDLDQAEVSAFDQTVTARATRELHDAFQVRESKAGALAPLPLDIVRKIALDARQDAVESWVKTSLAPATADDVRGALEVFNKAGFVPSSQAEVAFNHFWRDSKEQQQMRGLLSMPDMEALEKQLRADVVQALRATLESPPPGVAGPVNLREVFASAANRPIHLAKAAAAARAKQMEKWRDARGPDNYRVTEIPRKAAKENLFLLWDNPLPDMALLAELTDEVLKENEHGPVEPQTVRTKPGAAEQVPQPAPSAASQGARLPDVPVAMPSFIPDGKSAADPAMDGATRAEFEAAIQWTMAPHRNMVGKKYSNYQNIAARLFKSALEKGASPREAGLHARAGCVVHMKLTVAGYAAGFHQLGFSKKKVAGLISAALEAAERAIVEARKPESERAKDAVISSADAVDFVFNDALPEK